MEHSEQLNELSAALAKAQAKIRNAIKDSENPHFRSKYADLSSVWDACRAPLTENGLAVMQFPHSVSDETGKLHLYMRTMLTHSSGQWVRDMFEIPLTKVDAQGVVAACTYGRRAGLAAIAGVSPGDDDDGEAAVGRGNASRNAQDAPQATTAPQTGTTVVMSLADALPPSEPPSPAKAALQPVLHAADILNGWLEEIAKEHGRDIKWVRKYAKQYMAQEFPGEDVKTMTNERASIIAMRLVEIFRKDAQEAKELA